MKRGKNTCKILKEIRRQIAEANDIEFITSECRYPGDCLGTCPKCEAEVRYLEQQLEKKRLAGKAAIIIGVSMGITSLTTATAQVTKIKPLINVEQSTDTLTVKGSVRDSLQRPIPGVIIYEKDTYNQTITDSLGQFSIDVSNRNPLIVSFLGWEKKTINLSQEVDTDNLQITLSKEMGTLLDEVIVTKKPTISQFTMTGGCMTPKEFQEAEKKKSKKQREWEEENRIYTRPQEMPSYPGGQEACQKFIQENLQYPYIAPDSEQSYLGEVCFSFIVEKDGTLSNFSLMSEITKELTDNAIEVMKKMSAWNPGKEKSIPVRTKLIIHIQCFIPSPTCSISTF